MAGILREKKSSSNSSILKEKKSEQGINPTRFYSSQQEAAVAEATEGKQTANSGATMFGGKGDVLTNKFLLECKTKTTHSDSISLKKDWFDKNKKEALFDGKPYNALVFNFGPGEENHYVIDEWLFQELLDYLNKKED